MPGTLVRPGRPAERRLRRPRRRDRLHRHQHDRRDTGSGNDLIYAGDGDDIVFGQQGDDVIYGGNGNDILDRRLERRRLARRRRRHRRRHRQRLHRRRQRRVLLPQRLPRPAHARPRRHGALRHAPSARNDGVALVTGTVMNDPTRHPPGPDQPARPQRRHPGTSDRRRTCLCGNDYIAGGAGADEIWGQLGNDVIQGDGQVDSYTDGTGTPLLRLRRERRGHDRRGPAAGLPAGRPDRHAHRRLARTARRTTTTSLVVHPSIERHARTRRRRLHRGQRRQRHDLRRPRPGRHRRRQLRPLHLRPRRPARQIGSRPAGPAGAWRSCVSADGNDAHARRARAPRRRAAGRPAHADDHDRRDLDHGRRHDHVDRHVLDDPDARRLRLAHRRLLPGRRVPAGRRGPDLRRRGHRDRAQRPGRGHDRGATATITSSSQGGHARDSDAIAGDNAQIFRLVGTNGVAVDAERVPDASCYDNYAGCAAGIVPRAVQLLDYTSAARPTSRCRPRPTAVSPTRSTARAATTSSTA